MDGTCAMPVKKQNTSCLRVVMVLRRSGRRVDVPMMSAHVGVFCAVCRRYFACTLGHTVMRRSFLLAHMSFVVATNFFR